MDAQDNRRGKVTPENLDEAALLKAIWDATYEERKARGLHTQAAFGTEYGIGNQAAVGFFLNGQTALSKKAARGFAKGLGCAIADFSPRLAAEIDALADQLEVSEEFALVRRADVKFSAGHGHLVFHEGKKSALSFRREFLREIGVNEANAVIVGVKGHSMEPTIKDGAALLVSRSATNVIDREVYAFRLGDELYVKRLRRHGDTVVAESDNPDKETFPDIRINGHAEFEMIGRALWMGTRL